MLRVIVMLSAFALPLTELTARLLVLLRCRVRELIKVAVVRVGERFGGVVFTIASCKVRGRLVSVGVVIEPGRTVITFAFAGGTGTGTGS